MCPHGRPEDLQSKFLDEKKEGARASARRRRRHGDAKPKKGGARVMHQYMHEGAPPRVGIAGRGGVVCARADYFELLPL